MKTFALDNENEPLRLNRFLNRFVISLVLSIPSYTVYFLIRNYPLERINFYSHIQYSLFVFLALIGLFEGHHFFSSRMEKRFPWNRKSFTRLTLEVSFTIVYTPIVVVSVYSILYMIVWEMDFFFPSAAFYCTLGFFISLLFMVFVNTDYFLTYWQKAITKASNLEKERIRAKLESLQSQVSPHFLFNNFNILGALIEPTNQPAKKYLQKLSDVFRYILQNNDKEVVSVSEELAFIEDYSFLIKTRFEDKFKLKIEVEDAVKSKKIPPASLQHLVENAVKHNEASNQHPLEITISNKGNSLVVSNYIRKRKGVQESTKTGLKNLVNRYQYLIDEPVLITNSDIVFQVELPLLSIA